MKKTLFLLLLAPFFLAAQKGTAQFTLKGKLTGYADGTGIRLVKNGENTDLAATSLQNGQFELKGSMVEPVLCFLFIGEEPRPAEIFMENSTISFTADKASPGKYTITGSSSHDDFDGFIKEFLPLVQQFSSLAQVINGTPPGLQRDSLMGTYQTMERLLQESIDRLVVQKPASPVTPFMLRATADFKDDPLLLESRYNKLDRAAKETGAGKELALVIAQNKVGAIGSIATDFTQADTSGVPVSLSSFRGKYVLIDFWASWCGPCRQENPNVVENFKKFQAKNFTVLGVSLDRPGQKDKWLEAIKKDELTWTHVSDLQFWNNAVAVMYNVRGIPQNFLIDPEGKIIAKNLRGPALEAKLCEILGCN